MPKTPSSEQVQVNFRMSAELRDRLREASERNGRSLNAEIVTRLFTSIANEWIEEHLLSASVRAQQQVEEQTKLLGAVERMKDELIDEIASRIIARIDGDEDAQEHQPRGAVSVTSEKRGKRP